MLRVRAGTSGFAYKEWKGAFYPQDIKPAEMLGFYASKLDAVEINNTFYRMPRKDVLEKWANDVPGGFSFVLKAPQRITHRHRIKEDSADAVDYFFRTAEALGDKLGPVLVQLPPNLKKDVARLEGFLAMLPAGRRCAFELRHDSWNEDAVYDALKARGHALCLADTEEGEPAFVRTAGWGYLRLRRQDYDDDALRRWAARVGDSGWSEAFVFFKHEDEGAGPRLAARFLEICQEVVR